MTRTNGTWAVVLALGFGLTGCHTGEPAASPQPTALQSVPRPLAPPPLADPEAAAALGADEDELAGQDLMQGRDPELGEEDFSEGESDGFCVDDIYTKYLVSQYVAAHPAAAHPVNRTRGRFRHHMINTRKVGGTGVGALFYAKTRLTGTTVPYFGAIPVVANEQVELWIQYFKTAGRREFMRWLVRGESAKRIVQPLLQENGIPMEFFYLAMVESGFSNGAHSRAAATGTWQFMRGTARRYGLKINHWVDERRDPIKSSIAAAALLKDLYDDLGDWLLAMAAYNAGPGKVRRAIRQTKSRDFWQLAATSHLAKETKQYVPKVLAAVLLASDAKRHGFDFVANPNDLVPDTEVIVRRPIKLEELSAQLGIPMRTLAQWNPELIRNVIPPVEGGYALRLSSQYANAFPTVEQKLSLLQITDVQMHVVKKGDTLSRIAKQYKVDVQSILSINPELKARSLRVGREVAVPVPGVVTSMKPPQSA
jgi:membrane-bound lytic murein transglycosylase D